MLDVTPTTTEPESQETPQVETPTPTPKAAVDPYMLAQRRIIDGLLTAAYRQRNDERFKNIPDDQVLKESIDDPAFVAETTLLLGNAFAGVFGELHKRFHVPLETLQSAFEKFVRENGHHFELHRHYVHKKNGTNVKLYDVITPIYGFTSDTDARSEKIELRGWKLQEKFIGDEQKKEKKIVNDDQKISVHAQFIGSERSRKAVMFEFTFPQVHKEPNDSSENQDIPSFRRRLIIELPQDKTPETEESSVAK